MRQKRFVSSKHNFRVSKHVYILDLSQFSMTKYFGKRVRNMLQPIFKIGGDMYPDSLWSLWLINAPFAFRMAWAVIEKIVDPVVVAKTRILKGPSQYLKQMEATGIPLSAIPKELGGTAEVETAQAMVLRFREEIHTLAAAKAAEDTNDGVASDSAEEESDDEDRREPSVTPRAGEELSFRA